MNEIAAKKLGSLLSIAQKAGKLITGEDACVAAIRGGNAALVFTAHDASDNTRKKFGDKSSYYGVPTCGIFGKEDFERFTGKPNRATIVVADEGFAGKMQDLIDNL